MIRSIGHSKRIVLPQIQAPKRVRVRALSLLTGLTIALAVSAAPAFALQVAGSAPDTVSGTVVSVEPFVVPQTGVIVTTVEVLAPRPGGGSALTRFTMEGGEVGAIGMWSEHYAELHVGDYVIAPVSSNDVDAAAVAAPMTGTGLLGPQSSGGQNPRTLAVAAGYLWDGPHWSDDSLPVPFYVNSSGLPAGSAEALAAAAQTWEDDPGSYMDFTYLGATGVSSNGGLDGLSVIGVGDVSSPSSIAQCRFWYSIPALEMLEFDIIYNTAMYDFATNGSVLYFDVQGIGTHELGHTLQLLDLNDVENSDQVMYGQAVPGDTGQRVLGWGDIAGVRAIYPSAAPPPLPPLPVYRFRNLQNGFYLWSIDPAERAYINAQLGATWKEEGAAYWLNPATNTSTLWRFLNLRGGFYLYTADPAEKDTIVSTASSEWRLEGPAYRVSRAAGGRPVWRFRNKGDGTYLLSADPAEKDAIVSTQAATWQLEGPAFYIAQ